MRIFLYALGIWFIFVVAAILNGAFRNSFIIPKLGEYAGHVISTVILICVVLEGYSFFYQVKGEKRFSSIEIEAIIFC